MSWEVLPNVRSHKGDLSFGVLFVSEAATRRERRAREAFSQACDLSHSSRGFTAKITSRVLLRFLSKVARDKSRYVITYIDNVGLTF